MAIHSGDEWQYNHPGGRCLFAVDRWAAGIFVAQQGATIQVEGITEGDAHQLAQDYNGGVLRSRVWVFADGSELQEPWEEIDPWVRGNR